MFGISKIVQSMNLPGGIASALAGILGGGDQRRQFIAVLLATAAHIENKPNFNYELEMNDLWIRLGNLRGQSSGGALGQVVQAMGQLSSQTKVSSEIMSKLSETMRAVVSNVK
jgi:hypothetical protein